MSATQMAQDFAGLPERAPNPKQKQHRMSMFLPAYVCRLVLVALP